MRDISRGSHERALKAWWDKEARPFQICFSVGLLHRHLLADLISIFLHQTCHMDQETTTLLKQIASVDKTCEEILKGNVFVECLQN